MILSARECPECLDELLHEITRGDQPTISELIQACTVEIMRYGTAESTLSIHQFLEVRAYRQWLRNNRYL